MPKKDQKTKKQKRKKTEDDNAQILIKSFKLIETINAPRPPPLPPSVKAIECKNYIQWKNAFLSEYGPDDGTVIVLLLLFAWMKPNQWYAWPSMRTMAKQVKKTPATINKYIHLAQKSGWIIKEKNAGKGKHFHTSRYAASIPEDVVNLLKLDLKVQKIKDPKKSKELIQDDYQLAWDIVLQKGEDAFENFAEENNWSEEQKNRIRYKKSRVDKKSLL